MSNYPAGAEFDSSAPYNEDLEVAIECQECNDRIEDGIYCSSCFDYIQRENKKASVIDDLKLLQDLSAHLENTYFKNKLAKIILKTQEI